MKLNRQGATRIVIELETVVIKVPNFLDGWKLFLTGLLCNMQETMLSDLDWPELCPVVWSMWGGWFLVMKKARILTRNEYFALDYDNFVKGDHYEVPAERKMNSFGYYNGKIVTVDYGS